LAAHGVAQDVIHAHCVGVTDGDTIKVLTTEKQLLRIRVAWIDAPVMGQAFGQRAKQFMSARSSEKTSSSDSTRSTATDAWLQWSSLTEEMSAWS
jgi:endonuclease YncB( thermonuclease family)